MTTLNAPNGRSDETDEKFDRFCLIRDQAGLRAALGYLGTVTGYRRAAVIRQADEGPTAVAYFDREQPEVQQPDEWPAAVAAACLVRAGNGSVRQARDLDLVNSNAHTQTAASACRCVPVIDADGQLHASLCVFDEAAAEGDDIDLPLLLRVAARLARDGPDLTPDAAWQSAVGEEDPGSAEDVVPASSTRSIHGSSMSVGKPFKAASASSSSLHDS